MHYSEYNEKSLVHYGDNALVYASTKNQVSTTYFECTIRNVPYRDLCVKLRPSPPMWKISLRLAREHSFPLYLKKINCSEEMLYRKIDFKFSGVTLFKRALNCITLNIMKKASYIMEIMRWCMPAQKTRFQLRVFNVPLGTSHIGICALSYALHLRCGKFL